MVLSFLGLAGLLTGQVFTENAGVISPQTPILRETVTYFRYENAEEVSWRNQLLWALDRRHELRLTVPVVYKNVADATALGDISLRFKRSLWQADDVMRSDRWAFLAEVAAPTGDTGAPLPGRLQIGSGAWSVGAGTAYTLIRDRHRFSAELFYRQPLSEGDRFGSTADVNVAYWYRLTPAEFPPDDEPLEVRGVIELLSTYRWDSIQNGAPLGDHGWIVLLAPGLQIYPSQEVLLEGSVLLPVAQSVQDALGRREWGISGTVKVLF